MLASLRTPFVETGWDQPLAVAVVPTEDGLAAAFVTAESWVRFH